MTTIANFDIKERLELDGLKLFFGDVPVFGDIKAYIMTEEDEKTYLDVKKNYQDNKEMLE